MKRYRVFSLIIGLSIFIHPKFVNAQNGLPKVVESLQKIEGEVTVYYPPSIKKQAVGIRDLVEKAIDYYHRKLGISFPITVVLLGPEEYAQYTKQQYGNTEPYNTFIPHVEPGPPKVMFLPATGGSALDSLTQMALMGTTTIKKLGMGPSEISLKFTALVGLHELGHRYIDELEICQAVHWFQEMAASFIADAFLTDVSPSDTLLWKMVMEAYEHNLKSTDRTFSGIHKGSMENYIWWEGNVALMAHDIYQKYGLEFLEKLRKLSNVKIYHEDDLSFLVALDEIAPGFLQWAEKYGHVNVDDKAFLKSIEVEVRKETENQIAQDMPNLYTSSYSNVWQFGNPAYRDSAMKFLKEFETNNFKIKNLLADYIQLQFEGTNVIANDYLEKEKAMEELKGIRSGLRNLRIKLQAVIPEKSVDSDEDWVFVMGIMTYEEEDGKFRAKDFFFLFRIGKKGRINLIKEYDFVAK